MKPFRQKVERPMEPLAARHPRLRAFRASACCISMLVLLAAHVALGQPGKPSDEEYRQKYRQAAALMGEKKPADAKKLFLDLWATTKSHEVATSLGQIELVAQHYPEAALYLTYAVATYPPHQEDKQLNILKKWLDQAKKHVASYEVVTNVRGATVSVDGIDLGQTPLEAPLFVGQGRHLFMVNVDGYKRAERALNSIEGTSEKLDIHLEPVEQPEKLAAPATPTKVAPPPAAASVPPPSESPGANFESRPHPWLLVGGGALTVAGVVTGLVFNAQANSHFDQAEASRKETGSSGCYGAGASSSACASMRQNLADGDDARNASRTAFAIGGIALVGTLTYWFWPRAKSPATTRGTSTGVEALAAQSSRSGTWVGVSGRF